MSTDKKQLSAHEFKAMYQELGYDLAKLGCIMLDLEPLKFDVQESALYYAKDKSRHWIDGNVADKTPHVTLLYGLLRSGSELKKHVDTLLEKGDKLPKEVTIDHIGFFDSPYDDEPYYCIVAHLDITPELQEVHDRLTFLPHIETFAGSYKAHFTLCYIKKQAVYTRDKIIDKLNDKYKGKTIKATKINYGGNK